ncbi:MAG: endopeptidase La [Acidobacteriota bacterium]
MKSKPKAPEGAENESIEIPAELGILPVRNTVLFPGTTVPLVVGREKSVRLVDAIWGKENVIGLLAQHDEGKDDPGPEEMFLTGTVAKILKITKFAEKNIQVIVHGVSRFRVEKFVQMDPFVKARIVPLSETWDGTAEEEALARSIRDMAAQLIEVREDLPLELKILLTTIDGPGRLADLVAFGLNVAVNEKQAILETLVVGERLRRVANLLSKELEVARLERKIKEKVTSEMGKNQREYFLREQMKAIRGELGEDDGSREVEDLRKKVEESGMPAEVRKEADRELSRLTGMPSHAAEYSVIRTYLGWLTDLPWKNETVDNLDLKNVRAILDEDHYDLEKVKERILEYLAVRKLKQDMKGPILCFVGPPGTGKTSLGKSIARAMGRKFVRVSLGGVRDEAEIRGHRRTYIGALPGSIVQGMKKAGTLNPLFILDEVDKLGQDFRGDPASALLEVLDPEQNNAFVDHYLDVPYDLSKVMFITTANILDPIPPALKDRMEVLELPGYTSEEKLNIAKTYLLPKQLKEHGITAEQLSIDDETLMAVQYDYTREAGLRNLEREIARICRKTARKIVEEEVTKVSVGRANLHEYLGPVKYFQDMAEHTAKPGVAIGLAWTPTGGDILFIESTAMKGGKSLKLTGRLGDVMRESAEAALSYIRSRATQLGIAEGYFGRHDLHIHIPSGAIPKDGPSAGVTIAMSLLSLLTAKTVRPDVAMTGEISLRGKVLPVGGIKEKVLAAKRAGIKKILLPRRNENDLVEVKENARAGLEFVYLDTIDDAIPHVFSEPIASIPAGSTPEAGPEPVARLN